MSGIAFYNYGMLRRANLAWIADALERLRSLMVSSGSDVQFQNRVVAITGAAGGIGQALCRYFGGEGAAIAALDRSESVTAFAEQLRGEGITVESAVVDIVDAAAVAAAFAMITARLGPIDILINNAGVSRHPSLERTTPEGFKDDVNANLNGAYNCAHAVLPGMKARRAGSIVNIGSVNGLTALGDAAYSAAKAGLISLTKSLALEFGRYNIRANIVCPEPCARRSGTSAPAATRKCSSSSHAGIRSAASSSRSRSRARSPSSRPTPPRPSPARCCRSIAGCRPATSSWRAN